MQAINAPMLECMKDNLGVRMGSFPLERAPPLQFRTDGGVVVDLTIERNPKRSVLVAHRLVGVT